MKHILTIQDLSCVGKCSLTVAQPVLSAMGIACSVLPTAVLSTHTAFPQPYVRSLTEDMDAISKHWQSVGAEFDAILVGYLSDPEQAEALLTVLERFPCPVILDPAMGDNGKLYRGITQEHVEAMQDLSALATVLLPNVTEAALLTKQVYPVVTDGHTLRQMMGMLCKGKTETVVITGISPSREETGFTGMQAGEGMFSYRAKRIPKSMHGTGDLFSAVFSGAWLLGQDAYEAATLAAGFVERVMENTPEETPFGVEFEPQLPWLYKQL